MSVDSFMDWGRPTNDDPKSVSEYLDQMNHDGLMMDHSVFNYSEPLSGNWRLYPYPSPDYEWYKFILH